jgi:GNAT superfamily N-acetyltransferase
VLAPVDETPVWSIVCFVVGRRSRGRGVARALLAAGIDYARQQGATTLEAYPVEVPDGGRIPSANVYRGTLSMFEEAGFDVVARRQAPGSDTTRPIVRLSLAG